MGSFHHRLQSSRRSIVAPLDSRSWGQPIGLAPLRHNNYMNQQIPFPIFGLWKHSREEDAANDVTYRPASYDFPPARGRAGIEFFNDGRFTDLRIGRGDADQGVSGHWEYAGSGCLKLTYADGSNQRFEIIEGDQSILKMRRLDPS